MGYAFLNVTSVWIDRDPAACSYTGTYPPLDGAAFQVWALSHCGCLAATSLGPHAQNASLFSHNPFAANITITDVDLDVWWTDPQFATTQATSFLAHARLRNESISVTGGGTPPPP